MTAAAEAIRPVGAARAGGGWRLAWRRLRRDPFALVSGSFVAFALFMVFAGAPIISLLVGHGPNTIFLYGSNNLRPVPPWTWVPVTTVSVDSTAELPKQL